MVYNFHLAIAVIYIQISYKSIVQLILLDRPLVEHQNHTTRHRRHRLYRLPRHPSTTPKGIPSCGNSQKSSQQIEVLFSLWPTSCKITLIVEISRSSQTWYLGCCSKSCIKRLSHCLPCPSMCAQGWKWTNQTCSRRHSECDRCMPKKQNQKDRLYF